MITATSSVRIENLILQLLNFFFYQGLVEEADFQAPPEITQRNPVCDVPVSGGVPRRALGR